MTCLYIMLIMPCMSWSECMLNKLVNLLDVTQRKLYAGEQSSVINFMRTILNLDHVLRLKKSFKYEKSFAQGI